MQLVHFYFFYNVYYVAMILITIDRFMDIKLNIKYPIYWNEYKTKVSVVLLLLSSY